MHTFLIQPCITLSDIIISDDVHYIVIEWKSILSLPSAFSFVQEWVDNAAHS